MPDLAAVAKAIQEADEAHWFHPSDLEPKSKRWKWGCTCGVVAYNEDVDVHRYDATTCGVVAYNEDVDVHRYDAMARAAADALGVAL